jgi:hypothetical protein
MITLLKEVYKSCEYDILRLYYVIKDVYFPPKCKFCFNKMEQSKFGRLISTMPVFSNLKPNGTRLWRCPSCQAMWAVGKDKWVERKK